MKSSIIESTAITLIVIISLIVWFVLFQHLKKREYFPIKERSSWLTFTMTVCGYFSFVIYTVGLYFNKDQTGLQSAVFEECGKIFYDENNKLYDEQTIDNNLHKNKDTITINQYSLPFFCFLRIFLLSCFYFRSYKLGLAFNLSISKPIIIQIFSNEKLLILIAFIFSSIFSIICWITQYYPFVYYIQDTSYENILDRYQGQLLFWMIFSLSNQAILLYLYKLSKKVKRSYGFQTEMFIIFCEFFLMQNLGIITLFNEKNFINCFQLGPIYLDSAFQIFIDLLNFSVCIVYPLFLIGRGVILPPLIALQDYKNFLVDETYFMIFYHYLKTVEQNKSHLGQPGELATSILTFYMDLKMKSAQQEDEEYQDIVKYYFLSEKNIIKIIPENLQKQVLDIDEYSGQQLIKQDLKTENFEEIYIFLGNILSEFFKDYRKTRSNQYLKQQMVENDKINERMFRMKMIAIDS